MHSILALFGAYDNLHDAPDFFNYEANILGITISCMVSQMGLVFIAGIQQVTGLASHKYYKSLTTTLCQIITWTCALLRLYVRLLVLRAPGWDDLFVTLSLVSPGAYRCYRCIQVCEECGIKY